jgi:hypothetical protein
MENISKNTCELLNEAHTQTGLQTAIKGSTTMLAALYAATHAEAALTWEWEEALRKQIEECCPPKPPEPACRYEPSPAPKPLHEPPRVEKPKQPEGAVLIMGAADAPSGISESSDCRPTMPAVRVERFGPGESAADPRPGDFILIHSEGWLSTLIYLLQALRFRGPEDRKYRHWSHVALVTSRRGRIIEVVNTGVGAQRLEKYRNTEYHYVHIDASQQERAEIVKFAESCVGQPYGRLAALALVVAALTSGRFIGGDNGQQNCAALVARALARAGVRFEREPPEMLPADLAKCYDVTP